MSEQTPQDPYGGRPHSGRYPPEPYTGPPANPQSYPQAAYPAAYPQGYPVPGHPPPGYPPYGPPGYPYAYPPRPGRPGSTTASAVLAFVAGGLLLVAALILFTGAKLVSDLGDSLNADTNPTTAELTIAGLGNLVSAALLIAGGVMLAGRKLRGRALMSAGSGLVLVLATYWIARFDTFGGTVFYGLLFASLVVIAVSLAFTATTRAWLADQLAEQPRWGR